MPGLLADLSAVALAPQSIASSEHVQPMLMQLLSFLLLLVFSPPGSAASFSFSLHQLSSDYGNCLGSY